MRFLILSISFFSLLACGPREDEKNSGADGFGSNVKAGQTLRVTEKDQKLPTCSDSDELWNSIRLYYELNAIFDQASDLKVVLGKGGKNCVKVSLENSIQIEKETGVDTGEFVGTGDYYFVTKLELMRTEDFNKNTSLFNEVDKSMKMYTDQLNQYLNAEPERDEVTISYLRPADGSSSKGGGQSKDDDFDLPEGSSVSVFAEGPRLPTCSDPNIKDWGQIRLKKHFSGIYEHSPQMTKQLQKGSFNCYRVSDSKTLQLALENEDGKFDFQEVYFLVSEITILNLSDLVKRKNLLTEVAQGMGFEKNEEMIEALKDEDGKLPRLVTITSLTPAEEVPPGTGGGPVEVFKLPEAQGLKAGSCQEPGKPTWDKGMRVYPEMELAFGSQLSDKKATAFVSNGDFNCLVIGKSVPFLYKDQNNNWIADPSSNFKVVEIVIRDKASFLNDYKLAQFVAKEMAMEIEDFTTYIKSLSQDRVNVTRIEWE